MSVKPLIKMGVKFVQKNATKILAGGAVLSEIVGFWMMHKRAPIVHEKLKALPETATTMDKVKVAAPLYLPAALMLVTSSGCIIGGCALGEARLAAVTNLAMMSETALAKYEQKVIETIGEDKAKELHEQAAKEIAAEAPILNDKIINTGHGNDLFYDPLSGRLFESSKDYIYDCVNEINKQIVGSADMWAEVNDWFYKLGLDSVLLAKDKGWNIDNQLSVSFERGFQETPNGRPYKAIAYLAAPCRANGRTD